MPLHTLTLITEHILIGGCTGGNLRFIFTVPTTSSRPSIEMNAFNIVIYIFSPSTMPWSHRCT